MKLLKGLAFCAAFVTALCAAGCNVKSYEFYTNMPGGSYQITDKSFVAGEPIGGYGGTTPSGVANAELSYKQRTYYSMAADAELVVAADFTAEETEKQFLAFAGEVGAQLSAIDRALSATVADSDITNFNNAYAGEVIEISLVTYEVLSEAKRVYELTEGYYNPALYYNIFAYGFGGADDYPETVADLPADEDIQKYTELSAHFGELVLAESGGRYFAKKPDFTVEVGGETLSLKLDLGGIGKGYAVDKVDELFDKYGFEYGYFSFGTSSMAVKYHTSGAYTLGFSNPRSLSREPYLTTTVCNEKLSTSGDNEQYYILDGVRYCHVIDATTGKPVQTGIMSVTIIGGSAAEADALTTAIMAMGKERAVEFIESKLGGLRVAFTLENYVA